MKFTTEKFYLVSAMRPTTTRKKDEYWIMVTIIMLSSRAVPRLVVIMIR